MNTILKLKVNKNFKLYKNNYKNILTYQFTRQLDTKDIVAGGSVSVYEGPEWNEVYAYLNKYDYFNIEYKDEKKIDHAYSLWEDCVMETSFKPKYFGLLPFFVEDRQTTQAKKKFVLKMELLPESKYLKFYLAMISGMY